MAVDKQIIREYGAYANLVAGADPIELQLYMIGIANDTDEMIFRSDDGFHRLLDSGTTALSEHTIPFINGSGKVTQDNANLQFNDGTNTFTTNILTTIGVINAGGQINAASNIVVADGGSITLQEDITFGGATTENQIVMPDNLADALSFLEGANKYLTFDTTDGSEYVHFPKPVQMGDAGVPVDSSLFDVRKDQNGLTYMRIKNSTAGTSASAALFFASNSAAGYLHIYDDGYTDNTELADKFVLRGAASATALILASEHASGEIQFYAGGLASANRMMTLTASITLGLGTSEPLSNVVGAGGDFTGDGFHIKSDSIKTFLILEGASNWPNGAGYGANAIIFADATGAADRQMFSIGQGNNATEVLSMNLVDDNTDPGTRFLDFSYIGGTLQTLFNPGTADIDFIIYDDAGVLFQADAALHTVGVGAAPVATAALAAIAPDIDNNIGLRGYTARTQTSNYGVIGGAEGAGTNNYGVFGTAANATNNYCFYGGAGYAFFPERVGIGAAPGFLFDIEFPTEPVGFIDCIADPGVNNIIKVIQVDVGDGTTGYIAIQNVV